LFAGSDVAPCVVSFQRVTDELLNVLNWADVELDEADPGQLLKALCIIFATLDSPEFEGAHYADAGARRSQCANCQY
jgi:hypothetical protein